MGLLPDDVDFDSPWSDASDDLPKLRKRIAQLEAELSTVKEGRKLYKEIADEAIAERDALKAENERLRILLDVHRDTAAADAIRAEIT
jgi:regulator of replication initiation timing